MTITAMKEKLHEYIDSANEADVVEMYSFLRNDNAGPVNHWDDEEFVAEMDRRFAEMENGTDKGVTWEEVKKRAESGVR